MGPELCGHCVFQQAIPEQEAAQTCVFDEVLCQIHFQPRGGNVVSKQLPQVFFPEQGSDLGGGGVGGTNGNVGGNVGGKEGGEVGGGV
mmetsp:Transcript_13725/g.26610  ORF Transcript_13725/g.26610 Transcript_13725/m.26610 type:complete len:88 (-) Transcript_13725:965-1228(-)